MTIDMGRKVEEVKNKQLPKLRLFNTSNCLLQSLTGAESMGLLRSNMNYERTTSKVSYNVYIIQCLFVC